MERGVDTTINKQRGRFFDVKGGSLRYEGTPFSIGEGRFLVFVLDVPVSEVLPHYTPTIHHFVRKRLCLFPSPFGEGTGVRL